MLRRLFAVMPIVLLIIGCAESTILGKWERFGDDAEGAIVEVEIVGNMYHGKLLKSSGILDLFGFVEQDIKWRDMEQVGINKWKGKDLIKIIDEDKEIVSVEYKDVYFTLITDDILEIRKFAKEAHLVGTVQKWRRIEF